MIKLEFQRDAWDEEQKKLISPLVVSDGNFYIALDMRTLGKYEGLRAIAKALETLQCQK